MIDEAKDRIAVALSGMKAKADTLARRKRLVAADGDDILQLAYLTAHECCLGSPGLDRHILGLSERSFRRLLRDSIEYTAEVLRSEEIRQYSATDWGLPSPWEMEDARRIVETVRRSLSKYGRFALDVFISGDDPESVAPRFAIPAEAAYYRFGQGLAEVHSRIWRALAADFGLDALTEFSRRARIYGYLLDRHLEN